jgi:hypothetical protein
MSGSFELLGDRFVITNGDRTVATTNGTLLQFLTAEQAFTSTLTFPDINKSRLYQWQYRLTRAPFDQFFMVREAGNAVGALPQEWSSSPVIASAPAGADIFIGRVLLSRTTAPSHTRLGQPLAPAVPTGVEIPLVGGTSMIVETGPGISRAMTFDIEGGNLVAKLQHSVGPAAGNFGTNGAMPPQVPPNSTNDNFRRGAENVSASGVPALPVWWNASAPYFISEGTEFSTGIGPGGLAIGWANRARYGGPDEAPYTDPTNYTSTYAVTIRGRFGRRS